MVNVVKEPHTALFIGSTGCGKTQKVVELLQNEYNCHYDYIVILCPTLRENKTYQSCKPLWTDDDVFLIDPEDKLLEWIEKFSNLFRGFETLFVIDDCIATNELDKKRTKLLEIAISGRHRGHSLWLITQSYTAIPKNLRRQKKQLFTWFLDEQSDFDQIAKETNIIRDPEKWKEIQEKLDGSEFGCLHLRVKHPRGWELNC